MAGSICPTGRNNKMSETYVRLKKIQKNIERILKILNVPHNTSELLRYRRMHGKAAFPLRFLWK